MDVKQYLSDERGPIEQALEALLPSETTEPGRVHAAMRHSVFAGGKRIRPILAMTAARAGDEPREPVLRPAAALELIHTYSLIHDDLPAMDDDTLRRGKPTCHVAFDEATAVLAGDALLTLAFEVLATWPTGDAAVARRLATVKTVAVACGSTGLIGGQMADIECESLDPAQATEQTLEGIHRRKTAALLTASVELGGLLVGLDRDALQALRRYGQAIGLAFQIVDDILDVEGDAEALGKSAGKDAEQGKLTYPALLGVEASRKRAATLIGEAQDAVRALPGAGDPLVAIAQLILDRSN